MKSIGWPELLIILVIAAFVFRLSRTGDVINALIHLAERFRGGGPGSPSHPVPADDSTLVRRQRNTKTSARS